MTLDRCLTVGHIFGKTLKGFVKNARDSVSVQFNEIDADKDSVFCIMHYSLDARI